MLSLDDIGRIVRRISYKPGWRIELRLDPGDTGRAYVQVFVSAEVGRDAVHGGPCEWSGAKHYLSPHMCRQEVVGACFGAFKAAEEHELRENFRYRGVRIYNPHLDPEALVDFAADERNWNTRDAN